MVVTKKNIRSEEDRISQLPNVLIYDILGHLSTKEAVRTSILSTKWRNLWQSALRLDLSSLDFRLFNGFVSFTDRFLDFHKDSWIHKLCLSINDHDGVSNLTRWIDLVAARGIQHLLIHLDFAYTRDVIPLSLYTCETLVHLQLYLVALVNTEFVSLPCLKVMELVFIRCPSEATLEKLILGSSDLEDLKIIKYSADDAKGLQVRSQKLKRIHIYDQYNKVVIDAPLLQCFKTEINLKNQFKIIDSGFLDKVDIFFCCVHNDILTAISSVRDLDIRCVFWKHIFPDSKFQFFYLSRLTAKFGSNFGLDILLNLLQSCPKLESLILEILGESMVYSEDREAKEIMSSTVPPCLVSSLKFVDLKHSISEYEGEMKLVKYFLKNSTILEKLTLRLCDCNSIEANDVIRKEILAMPRCLTTCEILFL